MTPSWDSHYQHFDNKKYPPAKTLGDALNIYKKTVPPKNNVLAIDLGCGNGIDTFNLLEHNWSVIAIDKQHEALSRIKENIANTYSDKLQLRLESFEDIKELPTCNLINATFSLPFCHPNYFNRLWKVIKDAIISKGIFCGHFFGTKDSWSSNPEMTFHTKQQVLQLLEGFDIDYCNETEKKGKTISGKEKYWHVFHVVAQKK